MITTNKLAEALDTIHGMMQEAFGDEGEWSLCINEDGFTLCDEESVVISEGVSARSVLSKLDELTN